MTRFAGHVDYAGSEAQTFVAITNEGPRDKGKVPKRHTLAYLNANASKMSTEQVMKSLEGILEEGLWEVK